MIAVEFRGDVCAVKKTFYTNKRVALALVDTRTGAPVATATINVPEVDLAPDEVIIKDYGENEGMLDALLRANLVQLTGRTVVLSSYVPPQPIVKLLI